MASKLHSLFPWLSTPIIVNAPMGGFAGSSLATAVVKAGGFGFIGAGLDLAAVEQHLTDSADILSKSTPPISGPNGTLAVGVGFLSFISSADSAAEVVARHRPCAVWLFAAHNLRDYVGWAEKARAASPGTTVWVQVNRVADAVEAWRLLKPDVLVLQGADAGGHGMQAGAGVVSLLPEAADVLAAEGAGEVPLLATGGIVEGRGVAAALALGAAGVVMGTRFLASKEVMLPDQGYQDVVLRAKEGGESTAKTKLFDDLNAKGNIWPSAYDGRAVKDASYEDYLSGMNIEENRKLHQEASKHQNAGFRDERRRVTVWAGTGVGLVKKAQHAGEIVEEVRDGALQVLNNLRAKI